MKLRVKILEIRANMVKQQSIHETKNKPGSGIPKTQLRPQPALRAHAVLGRTHPRTDTWGKHTHLTLDGVEQTSLVVAGASAWVPPHFPSEVMASSYWSVGWCNLPYPSKARVPVDLGAPGFTLPDGNTRPNSTCYCWYMICGVVMKLRREKLESAAALHPPA